MKKTLSLLFLALIICLTSAAKTAITYYVSGSGSDSNNGTSTSTPWKTLDKVNSFTGFAAGDQILFNRGETFYGSLTIKASGSSGSPITFGAYGSGAKPIITGFKAITSWTNLGSNIWESSSSVSSLSYTNMVTVNSVNTPMGRYPNGTATLPYQNYANGTSITSSSLSGSTNWTGAELALYVSTYHIGRNKITAQSGGTLTYTYSASDGAIQNAPGWFYPRFFVQNDPRTLDSLNEWYYNPSTKKLRIYNTSTPSNVSISTIDNLININGISHITLDNLSISGANSFGIYIINSPNITVQNCDVNFTGSDGIFGPFGGSSSNLLVQNCTFNNSNNTGLDLSGDFGNAIIQNNTITNSGMIQGMGNPSSSNGSGSSGGIYALGAGSLVSGNSIINVGYIGVRFSGSNFTVQNNFIQNFCKVLVDGGGIYAPNVSGGTLSAVKILNNIIMNSPADNGIYLDEKMNNVLLSGNSIAYCNWAIYLHDNWSITVSNNTTYANGTRDGAGFYIDNFDGNVATSNISVKNNILVAQTAKQNTGYYGLINGIFPSSLTADSNYYARPFSEGSTIFTHLASVYAYYTLAQWKTLSSLDAHSKTSPVTTTDTSNISFVYNPTSISEKISLNGTYMDMKGKSYSGSITLAANSSAVLVRTGAATNGTPVANAGVDQTITLPTSSVTLSGSGSEANGTISSYSWAKVSGPSSGTITSASSASTTVTDLTQGTYLFQLKVTDNSGNSDEDTVQITVNASSGNLLPALNVANLVNGIDYKYYESTSFTSIPVFYTLAPVNTSSTTNFNISLANVSTAFAFNFTGYIKVPTDGQYTFYTNSDDGSNFYVDGNLVVNNDGLHGALEVSGTIGLKAGIHYISAGYFQEYGSEVFTVSYAGPGIAKIAIPSSALYHVSYSGTSFSDNNSIISDLDKTTTKAYPNPFVNIVNVNIAGSAGAYKLALVNVAGQIISIKSATKPDGNYLETINTSALQRGIYFLKIILADNTTTTIKLEKE